MLIKNMGVSYILLKMRIAVSILHKFNGPRRKIAKNVGRYLGLVRSVWQHYNTANYIEESICRRLWAAFFLLSRDPLSNILEGTKLLPCPTELADIRKDFAPSFCLVRPQSFSKHHNPDQLATIS